jgi:uroporphyrinogen decarboxylase
MRQAGRYLPEYRRVRARAGSFLDLCYTPELAVEVTLQPIRRYAFDAAILFSDILVVPDALGVPVSFIEGRGPVLEPVRRSEDIERLQPARLAEHLDPVYRTVAMLADALPEPVALIGFAGAPWTLAAYVVEGESTRDFAMTRRMARTEPDLFARLIDLLSDATIAHLSAQIEAGAQAVQLFDSWAGILPETEFERWCVLPLKTIARTLHERHPEVPVIVFPRGAGFGYRRFADERSIAALGLDPTVPLEDARRMLGHRCLQGNLDPVALLAGGQAMFDEIDRIVRTLSGTPFVFNLGHGVMPETDPDHVAALVERVREPAASRTRDG